MEQVVELPDGFVDVLDDDPVGDSVVEEDSVAGLADVVALRTLDLETLLAAVDRFRALAASSLLRSLTTRLNLVPSSRRIRGF